MTDEVMGLRVENSELKSKLALTASHGTAGLESKVQQNPPQDMDNGHNYKVHLRGVLCVQFYLF